MNKPVNKWARNMNRYFSKNENEIQKANSHMKKCSGSLVIREIQSKTTMKFQLIRMRIAYKQISKPLLARTWKKVS